MKKLMLACLLSCSAAAWAAPGVITGKVLVAGASLNDWASPWSSTNKDGVFVITVEGLTPACGSGTPRIAIPLAHPMYQTVVSIVLSAQAQNKPLTFGYLDTCTYRWNSWDFATVDI